MRSRIIILLLAAACLPFTRMDAVAQDVSQQFWPETDFFLKINSRVRGDFIVARSQDAGRNKSVEMGPDIEFYFKQFVKNRIKTDNTANRQLLTIKAGYHYLAGIGQPSENRAIV